MSDRNLQQRLTEFGSDMFIWARQNYILVAVVVITIILLSTVLAKEGFKAMKGKEYALFPLNSKQEEMSFTSMFKLLLGNKEPKVVSEGKIGTVMKETEVEEEPMLENEEAPALSMENFAKYY